VGDLWSIGLGDEQYSWLKKTLETSKAKYKFVFAHHVMGTGRGGVEVSTNYEWGGKDPKGSATFAEKRSNWELPIHDLMVKNGVSIFFQGHDHIFVHQERDGLIYQSMPNPADDTFTMFNEAAYLSGTKAPNSGHVRVTTGRSRRHRSTGCHAACRGRRRCDSAARRRLRSPAVVDGSSPLSSTCSSSSPFRSPPRLSLNRSQNRLATAALRNCDIFYLCNAGNYAVFCARPWECDSVESFLKVVLMLSTVSMY
jgi:hypothetical protein